MSYRLHWWETTCTCKSSYRLLLKSKITLHIACTEYYWSFEVWKLSFNIALTMDIWFLQFSTYLCTIIIWNCSLHDRYLMFHLNFDPDTSECQLFSPNLPVPFSCLLHALHSSCLTQPSAKIINDNLGDFAMVKNYIDICFYLNTSTWIII